MPEPGTARLRQIAAGDRGALAAVYDETYDAVYAYVYRRIGDVETARDLTADVYRRLLQAAHGGRGPNQHLRAWLYRTAHNLVVDHYRRQTHRRHLALDDAGPPQAADPPPELAAEQQLLAEQVRTALAELTPDQQQVIALKFLEGLSNQEVAALLDKPIGAVKSLQHRALAGLRRRLQEKVLP